MNKQPRGLTRVATHKRSRVHRKWKCTDHKTRRDVTQPRESAHLIGCRVGHVTSVTRADWIREQSCDTDSAVWLARIARALSLTHRVLIIIMCVILYCFTFATRHACTCTECIASGATSFDCFGLWNCWYRVRGTCTQHCHNASLRRNVAIGIPAYTAVL